MKPPTWTFYSLLRLRCPRCGADSFRAGLFRTARVCAGCGLVFEREQGFFAGAIYPLYALAAAVLGLVTVGGLAMGWGLRACLWAGAGVLALASPWLFWYARLAFLHTDHRFFREEP